MHTETLGRQNLRQVSHLHRDSVQGWSSGRSSWLRSPTLGASALIGVVTLVLRLSYAAARPTNAVGAGDVAGSLRFDVTHNAPAAPGSWLYVAAGHLLHVVSGLGVVHSLVVLAALASAAAAAFTCVAGTALGGRWVGIASGTLVASAPVSWFAGSTVSTDSFVAFLGALLVVLARRARRDRAHGVMAVVAVGLGAGVRLSVVPAFALLVVIVVVASVRTVGQLLTVIVAGVASVAVWFVPMITIQPGGLKAWLHAVHVQVAHAAHLSSVFVAPASGARTNIGTFGAWSLVTLGPAIVIAVLGILVAAGARLATRQPAGNASLRIWSTGAETDDRGERPWYQGTAAILAAALIPPVALVTLDRFSGGGSVLAYVVPATILLLLPVARLVHHRTPGVRRASMLLATVLVAGAIAVNVQRFVAAPGILPASVIRHHPTWWIAQARYQAPYADTAATIRGADRRGASAP